MKSSISVFALLLSISASAQPLNNPIGKGYNVATGKYADLSDVKDFVLDFDKLSKASYIENNKDQTESYRTMSGLNINEYAHSFQSHLSLSYSGLAFSGSMQSNFSFSKASYASTSFASIHYYIRKGIIKIRDSRNRVDTLKNYLAEDFKAAINNATMTPQQLFDAYGTHLITGCYTGGRHEYNLQINLKKVNSSMSFGAMVQASYKSGFASASMSASFQSETDKASFESNKTISVHFVGGGNTSGNPETNNGFVKWRNSITEDNAQFYDFAEHGLLAIWEFADKQSRRDELEKVYLEILKANQQSISFGILPRLLIADLKVINYKWDDFRAQKFNVPTSLPGGYQLVPMSTDYLPDEEINKSDPSPYNKDGEYNYPFLYVKTKLETEFLPNEKPLILLFVTDRDPDDIISSLKNDSTITRYQYLGAFNTERSNSDDHRYAFAIYGAGDEVSPFLNGVATPATPIQAVALLATTRHYDDWENNPPEVIAYTTTFDKESDHLADLKKTPTQSSGNRWAFIEFRNNNNSGWELDHKNVNLNFDNNGNFPPLYMKVYR